MKNIKTIVLVTISSFFLLSCAITKSPLIGVIYTGVKSPVAVTSNTGSTKVGTSQAISVLGIVAAGDASIDAASQSAGITKIHYVDEEGMSVLGIFARYKVFVYGE